MTAEIIIMWLMGFSLAYSHYMEKSFFTRSEDNHSQKQCGFHYLPAATKGTGPPFISMGGRLVYPNEYPFSVYIDGMCSGVLVSKRYVLTAAHCIVRENDHNQYQRECDYSPSNAHRVNKTVMEPTELSIYPGSRCPEPESCITEKTVYNVLSVRPHPEYNICNFENDIALIELEKDVSEKHAVPICMPDKNEMLSGVLSATGYGYDPYAEDPDKPALRVVDFDEYEEENGEIITIDMERDTCSGDSGGPLFQNNSDALTLVGITSGGPDCTEEIIERRGYYIDVRKHLEWICKNSDACPDDYETLEYDYGNESEEPNNTHPNEG
ncbi:hypothetical protein RB195_021280 [Necator americanus]